MTNTKAGAAHDDSSFVCALIGNGNRKQVTDTTGVTTYSYDGLDWLKSATYPGPTTTAYTVPPGIPPIRFGGWF